MRDPRGVSFDLARLPACHRCGAPAVVELDRLGVSRMTKRRRTPRAIRPGVQLALDLPAECDPWLPLVLRHGWQPVALLAPEPSQEARDA